MHDWSDSLLLRQDYPLPTTADRIWNPLFSVRWIYLEYTLQIVTEVFYYQIDENFYIPNDGYEYGVAYYDAFEDTDIYARLSGTSDDVKWSQGVEFVFPWTDNQYILLENNFKKSEAKRLSFKNLGKAKSAVTTFKRPTSKPKGSIDLYNKR